MCGKKTGMSKATQRKEKQQWAIEKPKLDNARKLGGSYFIDPDEKVGAQGNHQTRKENLEICCADSHSCMVAEHLFLALGY